MYLRLLLGISGDASNLRQLGIKEILVVTFTDTEAATEELRSRIRENIHRLRMACLCGHSNDPLLAVILAQLSCLKSAALHLLVAERQMDEAAIFTIHGFCQHILNQSTFYSGLLFQHLLQENESVLYHQVSADFWRRHCYPLPMAVARQVHQHWMGPEQLLAELLLYLQGELPLVLNKPKIFESILQRNMRIIAAINSI